MLAFAHTWPIVDELVDQELAQWARSLCNRDVLDESVGSGCLCTKCVVDRECLCLQTLLGYVAEISQA